MPRMLNVNCDGNKKLVNTDKVRFMIWNLPVIKTCPFRTAHCEGKCYARKAEKCYPTCLPSRESNYQETLKDDFVENMIYTIEKKLSGRGFRGKLAVFRIHESGDFYSLEYTRKWIEIAKHFEYDKRIVFTAYTKSIPYFIECGYGFPQFPQNLIVRSSLWDDTDPELVELTERYNFPTYTALELELIEIALKTGTLFYCRCNDCATCLACYSNKKKDVACAIH